MFVTDAYAQTAAAAPAAADNSPLAQFFAGGMSFPVMMALMFGILYFMVIRPQNQERKKLQQAIDALGKGDVVLTTGGIFATVVRVEKERIVLRIAEGTNVDFTKASIASIVTKSSD